MYYRSTCMEQEIDQENLQSDFRLKYFHVCLFSTILEDTITKLRIIEECNTELRFQKTLADMVHMFAQRYSILEPLVKDEPDEIDPKQLGCVEYRLNKLKADRMFVVQVLEDTYLNLTTLRQFDRLSDSVVQTEARRERLDFLIKEEAKNKLIYRDVTLQLHQLRNHINLVTYYRNNDIEVLRNSVQDADLNSATRSRNVAGWETARSEQLKHLIKSKEAEPADNIVDFKTKIDQEQHVHSEVELLFNVLSQDIIEKIEQWMKKYETDMEKIELQIERKKNELDHTYERRITLEETIEKHTLLIKNWVQFKEEREAARQYRDKMFNFAVIIQAWWRGLLVRNQLGPYKIVKKRGKPKRKKTEKKK